MTEFNESENFDKRKLEEDELEEDIDWLGLDD